MIKELKEAAQDIAKSYEARDYGRALREIMRLADLANADVAAAAPWVVAKKEGDEAKADLHLDCSSALEMFRLLTLFLKPVLPNLAENIEKFLNIPTLTWSSVNDSFKTNHSISRCIGTLKNFFKMFLRMI